MKIGVISDTHIPERAQDLPKEVYLAFKNVDLIIHAGDLVSIDVLNSLNKICPVKAVYGNMDSPEVKKTLKQKEIISIGNFKIGLIHGEGHPSVLIHLLKKTFDQKLDIIVFGHSHSPINEKQSSTLFFNPGSPTDTIFSPYRSYGIIEISDNNIKAEIVRLG